MDKEKILRAFEITMFYYQQKRRKKMDKEKIVKAFEITMSQSEGMIVYRVLDLISKGYVIRRVVDEPNAVTLIFDFPKND